MGLLKSARPRLDGAFSTPARAELAIAIAALKAHDELAAKLRAARPGLLDATCDADSAVDAAKAALDTATEMGAAHVIAGIVGEAPAAPLTAHEAGTRWHSAVDAFETAQAALRLADQQIRDGEVRRHDLAARVKQCAVAVLRESPAVEQITKRLETLQREFVQAAGEWIWLARNNVILNQTDWGGTLDTPEARAVASRCRVLDALPWNNIVDDARSHMNGYRWNAALEALHEDASAPIPEALA